jgi:ribosomal protein S18 acetylase RimI-like enzyme
MGEEEAIPRSRMVEAATPGDARGVADVQRLTWLATYPNVEAGITEEDVRLRVEGEHGELIPRGIERWRLGIEAMGDQRAVFVVKDGTEVIGFTAPAVMNGRRRIGALYVKPELQRHGIGGELLRRAIAWNGPSDDIYVNVASYNADAIRFYRRYGFVETGEPVEDDSPLVRSGRAKAIPEIEMVLRSQDC